ncbi:helicase loader [Microbacterium phage Antuna]|nr:helicase loader [Microbacterium phage Antuna]
MNKRETAMIVARVADIDRRTLSDTIVETWHEIIGMMPYDEALEALRIVASESPETIKPAHLLRARKTARAEIERRKRRADRQRELDASTREQRQRQVAAELRAIENGYPA